MFLLASENVIAQLVRRGGVQEQEGPGNGQSREGPQHMVCHSLVCTYPLQTCQGP